MINVFSLDGLWEEYKKARWKDKMFLLTKPILD